MQLPFALVRSWDQVQLGPTPQTPPDLDTLLEARFFDERQEIRLFRREETLCAAVIQEEPGDTVLQESYRLQGRFGRTLTYSRQLDTDEDGQTVVVSTRLSHWEGV